MTNISMRNSTVIYARFSSDRQSEVSIDAQVRACTEYAGRHGLTVSRIYKDEAISGTTANRTGYQEMLADAMADKFNIVLIHKYDRISRDMAEQALLDRKFKALDIQLIAVAQDFGDTKDGRLTKGITWALAEYYSANLSEEVRKGMREAALKAEHCGGVPPFGYDVVNKKLVINEIEAEYVRRMFTNCITRQSYVPLINEMNLLGITGKRGKPMRGTQIYEILKNEKYTGTFVYCPTEEKNRTDRRTKPNAIRVPNAFPAIVDRETFEQAQQIMSERKVGYRTISPISGLVYCECGHKMYKGTSSRTKNGAKYRTAYYRCAECGKSIRQSLLDDIVAMYMDDVFSENTLDAVEEYLRNSDAERKSEQRKFNSMKKARLDKAEAELAELINGLTSGQFRSNYAMLDRLISEKNSEIEAIKEMTSPIPTDAKIREWLEGLKHNDKTPKIFIDKIEVIGNEVEITSSFMSHIKEKPTNRNSWENVVAEEGYRKFQRIFDRTFFAAK